MYKERDVFRRGLRLLDVSTLQRIYIFFIITGRLFIITGLFCKVKLMHYHKCLYIFTLSCYNILVSFNRGRTAGNKTFTNVALAVDESHSCMFGFNRLTPNDPYMGRTAPLTSKRCILYIYSTNIGTEYFKHSLYSPFFFLFKMQFVS